MTKGRKAARAEVAELMRGKTRVSLTACRNRLGDVVAVCCAERRELTLLRYGQPVARLVPIGLGREAPHGRQ